MENNYWKILEAYRKGWDECFRNKPNYPEDAMLKHAYEIGWDDYIIGDMVSSVDLQTNKEIVSKIRKALNNNKMKTVNINGYEVSYDIKSLADSARHIGFDEINNQKKGECGHEYNTTEREFQIEKTKFIDDINKLDETIVNLVNENAVFTKAKKLHKGRNHKLIESGLYLNYDNEYGSHSYSVPHIVLVETAPNKAQLILSNIKEQSSF